ncbi:nuclear transport factor 2 family protein [Tsukamurella sp. M9C]|uniref:nuclear transport factor 2 family protein n=1 Tax=Tsukamurella sp. M9C TaxID=2877520 RepID=UPI001CCE5E8C|nr:nuclear transport factor 2 family protein [Tsukamurella sp. M9C]MCA0155216.1 nuclear transport factor 2 family protein [Tsukamurella sp. M9C]
MPGTEAIRRVVEASPAAVAAHDKDAWTALFAPGGAVHDPVGPPPQTNPAAIARFYDMFIAPNRIVFDVEHDLIVPGEGTGLMIRDLTVHTTMSTGVTLHIPMHLRYTVTDGPEGAAITGLYAHWELRGMIAALLLSGPRGLAAGALLGPRLFRTLGTRAALGFLGGIRGVGGRGRRRAADLLHVRGLQVGKVLASGSTVTATVYDGDRRGLAVVDLTGTEPALTLHLPD